MECSIAFSLSTFYLSMSTTTFCTKLLCSSSLPPWAIHQRVLFDPTALALVCSLAVRPPARALVKRLADYRQVVSRISRGLGDATAWRGAPKSALH